MNRQTQTPDLTLPTDSPELGSYGDKNWDDASFALYTLVDIPTNELESIASLLDNEWMENQGNGGLHLVRLAPLNNGNLAGKNLADVVKAHIRMDKGEVPRCDAAASGDLSWYPSAFLVVASREWETDGLLFVYADTELADCPMDKFFFCPKDGYLMLSSIVFGEDCARSKEIYAIRYEYD